MEVREEKEYQGRRTEEWDEKDEMGKIGDIMRELSKRKKNHQDNKS